MKKKKKVFTAPIELKEDETKQGQFRAVFATLNVIDLDGDVTEPGAFKEQEVIVEPWNHSWDAPAGKGVINSDGKEAWIEGQFFLDTLNGQETYKTVKNMGDLAEWSYTFYIENSAMGQFESQDVRFLRGMDVVGVSPVTRGAGIDTRTEAIKGEKNNENDEDETLRQAQGKSSVDINTQITLAEIGQIVRRMEIEEDA